MNVLIAPDKFKGSLTAPEVVAALGSGLQARGISYRRLPLADGGDGSVRVALAAGFSRVAVTVAGATGEPRSAEIAVKDRTAVVEVANTCGLHTLPGGRPAPFRATTTGLGQAIRAAVDQGAVRIVVALGGSASTDGGTGMLAAIGARFQAADGRPLAMSGAALHEVASVDLTGLVDLRGVDLVIAGDVTNPLIGPSGAAAIFGPQKGASPADVEELDRGLRRLVRILAETNSGIENLAETPGSGAAGGAGFAGLLLGGRMVSGAEFFLDLLDFDEAVADCDVVITGEGRLDDQTLDGKLPAIVARRSRPRPVIAVVGHSELSPAAQRRMGLAAVYALTDRTAENPALDPDLTRRLLTELGRSVELPGGVTGTDHTSSP